MLLGIHYCCVREFRPQGVVGSSLLLLRYRVFVDIAHQRSMKEFDSTAARGRSWRLSSTAIMVVFALLVTSSRAVEIKSTTYHDERWAGDPQVIPGKVWFAYCDVGEGLGYHIQGPCKNRCSCAFNNCEGENDNYLNKCKLPYADDRYETVL